jgi:hypothetical protein
MSIIFVDRQKSRKNETGRRKSLPVAVLHDEGRANILDAAGRRLGAGLPAIKNRTRFRTNLIPIFVGTAVV